MSEYIPGPWFVDKGPIYDSSSKSYVWGVTNDLTEDEETGAVTELMWVFREADARLIAAAPTMVEAIEAALAIHQRYCDRVGAEDNWAREVHAKLENALAQARGQS